MNKQEQYLFVYDRKLFDALRKKGIPYITKARNVNNDKVFTLFEKTDEVKMIVNDWVSLKS